MTEETEKIKDNYLELLKYICTILTTIVISMTGFWLLIGKDYVNKAEAKEIAVTEIATIALKLDIYIEEEKKIKTVIEKNTEVVFALKNQLALLEQALNSLKDSNNRMTISNDANNSKPNK